MPRSREFPNPVAVFNDRFLFTTLSAGQVKAHVAVPYAHPETGKTVMLFSLDDKMHYTPFAKDYGPFNLAFTYSACLRIHNRLELTEARKKPLCLYTTGEAERKSNMALVAALYFVIVGQQAPWNAFRPIAEMELVNFRDAGGSPMDYGLSVQDVLYGVDKAIHHHLLDLVDFDMDDYQKHEQVQHGDLNVLGPFIPFASPQDPVWIRKTLRGDASPPAAKPGKITACEKAMECVVELFERENVGLVVRLNDELYDRQRFLDLDMDHVDMYFDDGSCPSDEIVSRFIKLAEDFIERRNQKIAVHCKAGLGRTGVLIGAYLIYKYSFTAQEAIGYMRLVRPGMVVGVQQQYMVINQMKWAGWAARDQLLRELAANDPSKTPFEQINPLATPPAESDIRLPGDHLLGQDSTEHDMIAVEALATTCPISQSLRTTIQVVKAGDAAGQPRKAVADCDTPPTAGHFGSRDPRNTHTSSSSELGSLRGTKRSAARAGSKSDPSRNTPSPKATSGVPSQSLPRPTSSVSMVSTGSVEHDPRPMKRRSPSGSPLSRPVLGLSSPPPSRENTPPSSDPLSGPAMLVDDVSSSPPVILSKSTRWRRRIISSSPAPVPTETAPIDDPFSPPAGSLPEPQATLERLRPPPKRSFLPTRRVVASKQTRLDPKHISHPLVQSKNDNLPACTSERGAEVKTSTPRRAAVSRGSNMKGLRTPPRITEMWGQISKIASSPPAPGC
ncbi:hypothetical protein IAU60_000038 [Kwoniella sp. DSM 27419]